jgi:hypothetical protein
LQDRSVWAFGQLMEFAPTTFISVLQLLQLSSLDCFQPMVSRCAGSSEMACRLCLGRFHSNSMAMSLDLKRYKPVLAGSWFLVDPEGLGLVFLSICKTLQFWAYFQNRKPAGFGSRSKVLDFWFQVRRYSFYKALRFQIHRRPGSSVNSSPIKWSIFINCFHIQKFRVHKQSYLGYVSI